MARLSKSYQAVYRSILESRRVNSVSDAAEALYFRLLCASDDYGRFHGDAFRVCAQALMVRWEAGSVTPAQVEERLAELEAAGSIRRYTVGPDRFLEIVDYGDPTASTRRVAKFPAPTGASVAPDGASVAPAGTSEAPVVPLRARAGSRAPSTQPEQQPERAGARVEVDEPVPFEWPPWVDASNRDRWCQEITDASFSFVDVRSSCAYLDGIRQAIAQVTAPRPGEDEMDARIRQGSCNVVADVVDWLRNLDGRGRAICTGALRKGPLAALWRHPRLERDDQANLQERERRTGGPRGKAR